MNRKEKILFVLVIILVYSPFIVDFLFRPTNSLELYQEFVLVGDYEKAVELMQEGYEKNLTLEQYNSIVGDYPPTEIRQFTILQHNKNDLLLIETSPGTKKMKILEVEKLPKEIANYIYSIGRD